MLKSNSWILIIIFTHYYHPYNHLAPPPCCPVTIVISILSLKYIIIILLPSYCSHHSLLNNVESSLDKQFYGKTFYANSNAWNHYILFLHFFYFFKKSEASFIHIILHRILDKSSNQNKLNGYTWPYHVKTHHDNVGTNW